MKQLTIRALNKIDVEQIVALDQICLGGLWTAEAYVREIASPNSTLLVLKAKDSDQEQLIGMGCLWSIVDEAHITLLGIAPNYRRQGLGQLVLIELLQDAIVRNLAWATLEVNVKNRPALGLYQKYGFRVVGTRKGYYQATGDDAQVLWLKDLQQPEFRSKLQGWQDELQRRIHNHKYHWK